MGRRRERGVALLMVIWVLTALSVILSEFVFASRTAVNAARNAREDAAGYYLALGAFRLALEELGGDYSHVLAGGDGGAIFVKRGESPPEETGDTTRSGSVAGAGKYSYHIRDEESKMNINRADRKQLAEYFREIGLGMGVERDTVLDSILDWRDADDLHRMNGAEDDYYESLTPPYRAKNGPFSTAGELLLVRGVTREVLGATEGTEITDRVTVYGDRPNYNTAPREVLVGWLGAQEADKIVTQRDAKPFTDTRGQSSYFTIETEGQAEGAAVPRRLRAVVSRQPGIGGRKVQARILEWWDLTRRPVREEKDEDED